LDSLRGHEVDSHGVDAAAKNYLRSVGFWQNCWKVLIRTDALARANNNATPTLFVGCRLKMGDPDIYPRYLLAAL
jgi:hypothetical protein